MARCGECGFDWEMGPDEVVSVVGSFGASYQAGLTRFLAGEDGEALVRRRPAPGVWSALEYTAHMRDVVRFYRDRIGRVLTEDRPALPAADFAAMAEQRRYRDEAVQAVLDALHGELDAAGALLRSLSPDDWAQIGVGSGGDERTVLVLARRLAHDGHHHLLDLGRVLRQGRRGT